MTPLVVESVVRATALATVAFGVTAILAWALRRRLPSGRRALWNVAFITVLAGTLVAFMPLKVGVVDTSASTSVVPITALRELPVEPEPEAREATAPLSASARAVMPSAAVCGIWCVSTANARARDDSLASLRQFWNHTQSS